MNAVRRIHLQRLHGNIGHFALEWEAALPPLQHYVLEYGAWHLRRADNHQGLWTLLQQESYRGGQIRVLGNANASMAALYEGVAAYVCRDGKTPQDDARLCWLARRRGELAQEARGNLKAIFENFSRQPVDGKCTDATLSALSILDSESLFVAGLELLKVECTRQLRRDDQKPSLAVASRIVEYLENKILPDGEGGQGGEGEKRDNDLTQFDLLGGMGREFLYAKNLYFTFLWGLPGGDLLEGRLLKLIYVDSGDPMAHGSLDKRAIDYAWTQYPRKVGLQNAVLEMLAPSRHNHQLNFTERKELANSIAYAGGFSANAAAAAGNVDETIKCFEKEWRNSSITTSQWTIALLGLPDELQLDLIPEALSRDCSHGNRAVLRFRISYLLWRDGRLVEADQFAIKRTVVNGNTVDERDVSEMSLLDAGTQFHISVLMVEKEHKTETDKAALILERWTWMEDLIWAQAFIHCQIQELKKQDAQKATDFIRWFGWDNALWDKALEMALLLPSKVSLKTWFYTDLGEKEITVPSKVSLISRVKACTFLATKGVECGLGGIVLQSLHRALCLVTREKLADLVSHAECMASIATVLSLSSEQQGLESIRRDYIRHIGTIIEAAFGPPKRKDLCLWGWIALVCYRSDRKGDAERALHFFLEALAGDVLDAFQAWRDLEFLWFPEYNEDAFQAWRNPECPRVDRLVAGFADGNDVATVWIPEPTEAYLVRALGKPINEWLKAEAPLPRIRRFWFQMILSQDRTGMNQLLMDFVRYPEVTGSGEIQQLAIAMARVGFYGPAAILLAEAEANKSPPLQENSLISIAEALAERGDYAGALRFSHASANDAVRAASETLTAVHQVSTSSNEAYALLKNVSWPGTLEGLSVAGRALIRASDILHRKNPWPAFEFERLDDTETGGGSGEQDLDYMIVQLDNLIVVDHRRDIVEKFEKSLKDLVSSNGSNGYKLYAQSLNTLFELNTLWDPYNFYDFWVTEPESILFGGDQILGYSAMGVVNRFVGNMGEGDIGIADETETFGYGWVGIGMRDESDDYTDILESWLSSELLSGHPFSLLPRRGWTGAFMVAVNSFSGAALMTHGRNEAAEKRFHKARKQAEYIYKEKKKEAPQRGGWWEAFEACGSLALAYYRIGDHKNAEHWTAKLETALKKQKSTEFGSNTARLVTILCATNRLDDALARALEVDKPFYRAQSLIHILAYDQDSRRMFQIARALGKAMKQVPGKILSESLSERLLTSVSGNLPWVGSIEWAPTTWLGTGCKPSTISGTLCRAALLALPPSPGYVTVVARFLLANRIQQLGVESARQIAVGSRVDVCF